MKRTIEAAKRLAGAAVTLTCCDELRQYVDAFWEALQEDRFSEFAGAPSESPIEKRIADAALRAANGLDGPGSYALRMFAAELKKRRCAYLVRTSTGHVRCQLDERHAGPCAVLCDDRGTEIPRCYALIKRERGDATCLRDKGHDGPCDAFPKTP